MRQWPRRFAETLFEDETRQVQALGTLVAFTVAFVLLTQQTPADPKIARALFYVFTDTQFGVILIVAGALQLIAFPGPWWQLRLAAACVKLAVWAYAGACYLLTNPDAMAGYLLMDFAVAEFLVAFRALHDRTVNGSERRGVERG